MALDLNKIDLRKKIVFDLAKSKGIENQKAQVVLCMDISGSMQEMYYNGYVQDVLERIVPVAMQFDDNQEFELYLFENSCKKHATGVTVKNVDGIVNREILGKYEFGGTEYAPPILQIINHYSEKGGFFKKAGPMKLPVYVIFITDGQNSDKTYAEKAIRDASQKGIFFQFVGIGGAEFPFLEKLDNLTGRLIDNANFMQVKNLKNTTDEELYAALLAEFPSWLPLAKQNNLIL